MTLKSVEAAEYWTKNRNKYRMQFRTHIDAEPQLSGNAVKLFEKIYGPFLRVPIELSCYWGFGIVGGEKFKRDWPEAEDLTENKRSSNLAVTMELTSLEEQVRALQLRNSQAGNFLEALGVTLLDEEDYDEATKMLREALGR